MYKFIGFVFVILFSVVGMSSMSFNDLITSHDSEHHITRIIQFHKAITDGQFPPRWAPDYFGGIGSPVLLLTYQLPYYVSEVFITYGFNPIEAYNATLVISYILSGLTAYFAFLTIGNVISASIASIIYLWVPYRFLDVYIRGAYGESFSFIFPPLLLLGISKRSFTIMTVAITGLLLSHPVSAAGYLIVFTLLMIGRILIYKTENSDAYGDFRRYVSSIAVSFLVSGYSLLPIVSLTHYSHYSFTDTFNQFPSFSDLLPFSWLYGFPLKESSEIWLLKYGDVQFLILFITILIFIKRVSQKKYSHETYLAFMIAGCTVACIMMMHKFSMPVWKFFSLDKLIDFPWRMHIFITFFTAYLMNWILKTNDETFHKPFIVICMILTLIRGSNFIRIDDFYPWNYTHYFSHMGTGDVDGEYASLTRANPSKYTNIQRKIDVLYGDVFINITKDTSNAIEANMNSNTPNKIRINKMYFPGWKIYIDGNEQSIPGKYCEISSDKSNPEENTSGLVECKIPAGRHTIQAKFGAQFILVLGNTISYIGGIIFMICMILEVIRNQKNRRILLNN